MDLITREELKARIDAAEKFKLVMALNEFAFNAMHIPGSIHFQSADQAFELLDPDDDIVVYCSDEACVASKFAYEALVRAGYRHVRRYAGGLSDWAAAGYPLEGAST
jgi:rhodanese-related sulfurtransferase